MMSVAVSPGVAFSISPPQRLFSTAPYTPIPPVPSFDVSPDGRQIVFDRSRNNSDLVLIDLPKAEAR